ncbi:MAG: di-heme oxidoredictase family protein [Sandaracinus sp.]
MSVGRARLPRVAISSIAALACLAWPVARALELPAVPWPNGSAPSDPALDAMVAEATALADRERADRWLEAYERGEDHEHFGLAQEDIDRGAYDLAFLFRGGDAFFEHRFAPYEGLGAGPLAPLRRVHGPARGGPDALGCADCHALGGPDGAGTEVENAFFHGDGDGASSAAVRNPPHALGLGFVQALAAEMTRELAFARETAIAAHEERTLALATHGVSFGTLVVHADGSVDTRGVEGIDSDLVVRPFGWRGTEARLRRVVEEAARVHSGLQSTVLAGASQTAPDPERLGAGPWYDPDADGVVRELEEGTLTAVAVYLAMLEVPTVLVPGDPALADRWAHGHALFESTGCEACHRETLELADRTWIERPDTTGGPGVTIRLLQDGETPRGSGSVHLFSDLKRHAMGEALTQPEDDGSGLATDVWITRPLWGLSDTAPYLHDGRAATIPEAILAHDGEARASRDAFAALDEDGQHDLTIFLMSLARTPRPRYAR